MTNAEKDADDPALEPDLFELLTQRRGISPELTDIEVMDAAIAEIAAYRDATLHNRAEIAAWRADVHTRQAAGIDVSAAGARARLLASTDDHGAVPHSA